ncbi:hypothetical protein EV207_1206 [Scopulibacillus darangshiensis]|uniref:Uncharacterized protein n=1 Tax=Scopulibacillus darangshiensis TaxID=442528 RepID=A0A4R2NVK6_9BACL|nr:hypothetical protein [Scopulibacillus darangshiensis]TCP25972.1 hypothetical protein EV207_1206 [Scopulibacillus darangshiensis]
MWLRVIPYLLSAFFSVTAVVLVMLQAYEFGSSLIDFIGNLFNKKT